MYFRVATLISLAFQLISHGAQTRDTVPDVIALGRASQTVDNVYKADIATARKPEQKAALADRLLDTANATTNDSAGRFALLLRARDLAVQAGDVLKAVAAVQQIVTLYAVDDLEVKTNVLSELARVPAAIKSSQDMLQLADEALESAVAADRFDAADKTVSTALSISAKANDPIESRRWEGRKADIGKVEAAYAECKNAIATLKTTPADPAALLTVGKYECFAKGDWERGLPMLAAGNDPELKSLAMADLGHASSVEAQMPIADGWWSVAEKQSDSARSRIRQHAASIYSEAAPQLTGLARAKVDKRIEEATEQSVAGKGIDLLRRIDLKRDFAVGKWSFHSDGLHCEFQHSGQLVLPYIPPKEYDVRYSFTPGGGNHGVGIALPVGKGLCDWRMGHFDGQFSGFENVDGKSVGEAGNPAARRFGLKVGRRYTVVLQVRANGVRAIVDGVNFVELKTDGGNLTRYGGPGAAGDGLALLAHEQSVVFHSVEVVEISGKGKSRN